MKCEILYGPEAGTIKHFANNDNTAHTLIRAGALRLVENEPGDMVKMPNGQVIPKMGPPPEPKWTVALVGATVYQHRFASDAAEITRVPAIVFEVGSTVYERYTGEPKDIKDAWPKRYVPERIAEQYAKLHKEFYRGK
jgi:hypothetical protein